MVDTRPRPGDGGAVPSLRRIQFTFATAATRIMKSYCDDDSIPKEQSPIVPLRVFLKFVIEHTRMLAARRRLRLVLGSRRIPCYQGNTGNFIDLGLGGALPATKPIIKSVPYGPIPDASEQGIF
jgi:hypothetical protein